MNFDLTEDQRALVDTVEKFAAGVIARRTDPSSTEAMVTGTIDRWQEMAELGLAGLMIAEDDGGLGLTTAETLLICEALGQSLVQPPFISYAVIAPKLIETSSSTDVRTACLQGIAGGSIRIAMARDESILDFDQSQLNSRVEDDGGILRLSGTKELVIDGVTATHFIVTAQLAETGPNAFLVAAGQPGLSITPLRGLGGGLIARLSFDAVEAMALFEGNDAPVKVDRAIDHGIVAFCAEALGLMNRMLALTAGYLKTRHQFGKPIGSFQALQHRFADMVVAAEQSRSATYMAAAALAEEDAPTRKQDVSAAKSLVCRHGRAVLEAAIQLHGAIGITDEYELSRYLRRMLEIEKTWGDAIYHEDRFSAELMSQT